jgi:hypothetical protein
VLLPEVDRQQSLGKELCLRLTPLSPSRRFRTRAFFTKPQVGRRRVGWLLRWSSMPGSCSRESASS